MTLVNNNVFTTGFNKTNLPTGVTTTGQVYTKIIVNLSTAILASTASEAAGVLTFNVPLDDAANFNKLQLTGTAGADIELDDTAAQIEIRLVGATWDGISLKKILVQIALVSDTDSPAITIDYDGAHALLVPAASGAVLEHFQMEVDVAHQFGSTDLTFIGDIAVKRDNGQVKQTFICY